MTQRPDCILMHGLREGCNNLVDCYLRLPKVFDTVYVVFELHNLAKCLVSVKWFLFCFAVLYLVLRREIRRTFFTEINI